VPASPAGSRYGGSYGGYGGDYYGGGYGGDSYGGGSYGYGGRGGYGRMGGGYGRGGYGRMTERMGLGGRYGGSRGGYGGSYGGSYGGGPSFLPSPLPSDTPPPLTPLGPNRRQRWPRRVRLLSRPVRGARPLRARRPTWASEAGHGRESGVGRRAQRGVPTRDREAGQRPGAVRGGSSLLPHPHFSWFSCFWIGSLALRTMPSAPPHTHTLLVSVAPRHSHLRLPPCYLPLPLRLHTVKICLLDK